MVSGMSWKKPIPEPSKGEWPSGDIMTKENFVSTAYAVIQEMIGDREKKVSLKESRIGEMEKICRTCLAAIEDSNPALYKALKKQFDEAYK